MIHRALSLSLLAALLAAPGATAAEIGPLGTNQRTLVICVRWNDALTTRLANCSDWVTLLSSETNTFYNRATFSQTNFLFETVSGVGAPANGWFDLTYPRRPDPGMFVVGQDAIRMADPFVNFANYNRVVVITSATAGGGRGGGPWWWAVNEGAEATVTPILGGEPVPSRFMTMSVVHEWHARPPGSPFDDAASVVAHELGHQLGVPTHYDRIFTEATTRDTISPWDIMGYSPSLNHFLGYPKIDRGWLPAGPRIVDVGPPLGSAIDLLVSLQPLEQSASGAQVIRIPLSSGPTFVGYMVENRRPINGDELLPEHGVLVTAVDESPNSAIRAFVMDDSTAPRRLDRAALDVGQAFTDAAHNLTASVLSQSGDNYNVRVQYAPAATTFDPAITPWGAPPWETADIWVDSLRNMFDTYLYTDAAGNPIGNGDDAWVGHNNRLYARIHNSGSGPATNVRVQMYVNSPPGMGDAGPYWDYLGTILFPNIAPGGEARGYVYWVPTVGAHTCVKAVILDMPGELLASNNVAQENVTQFDTSMGSPYEPVHLEATVYNPFDIDLPIRINVRDVPYGWAVKTDPPQMTVPPRGRHPVHVTVFPSGIPAHEADGSPAPGAATNPQCPPEVKWDPAKLKEALQIGFVGKPKVEAQMPYQDTWISIGGIDIWTRLVHETQLTCHIAGTKDLTDPAFESALRDALNAEGDPLPPPADPNPSQGRQVDASTLHQLFPLVPKPQPEAVVPHGRAVIEGQLTPPIAGAVIAIEVREGNKSSVEFVKTDAQGRYQFAVKENGSGRTVVQAFYAGDREHGPAESGFCAFTAK